MHNDLIVRAIVKSLQNAISNISNNPPTTTSTTSQTKSIDDFTYKYSEINKSLDITYTGAANNYTVALGSGVVNGHAWTRSSIKGERPVTLLKVANYSLKDPFILKDGSTYYMYYTFFPDTGADYADIAYATSTDLNNWTHQGVVVSRTSCWAGGTGGVWAPYITNINGLWYMFVCQYQQMGYLTSTSLTSGWVWNDFVRNNSGAIISGLDPHIVQSGSSYYLVYTENLNSITLCKASSILDNRWVLVKAILSITETWEKDVTEAPWLMYSSELSKWMLWYGGATSDRYQRIGLAVTDNIEGTYQRLGMKGMIYLDHPMDQKGSISHPCLYHDDSANLWYMYCCTGTDTLRNNRQEIMGYVSNDLFHWRPMKTSTELIPSVTNFVYVNPCGQIIHSSDLPYHQINTDTLERIGYLRLGSLTVNSSKAATAFTKYRQYDIQMIISSSGEKPFTNTAYEEMWTYIGSSTFPDVMAKKRGNLVCRLICSINQPSGYVVSAQLRSALTNISGTLVTSNFVGWKDYVSDWIPYTITGENAYITIYAKTTGGTYSLGGATVIAFALEY